MSEYINKKYTVTCTIKIETHWNSRCICKEEAIECFKALKAGHLELFKDCEVTYDVVEHKEVQNDEI